MNWGATLEAIYVLAMLVLCCGASFCAGALWWSRYMFRMDVARKANERRLAELLDLEGDTPG